MLGDKGRLALVERHAHRSRQKAAVTSQPETVPTPAAPRPARKADFTIADEAASALSDKGRLALVERHVNRLGMVTIFSAVQNIAKTLS